MEVVEIVEIEHGDTILSCEISMPLYASPSTYTGHGMRGDAQYYDLFL